MMKRYLPARCEPLFADGAGYKVGGYAGPSAIAAILTGRLHPDVPHPSPSPLPVFQFVLFNKWAQFFVVEALLHTVKPFSLAPRLNRRDLPYPPDFYKLFL